MAGQQVPAQSRLRRASLIQTAFKSASFNCPSRVRATIVLGTVTPFLFQLHFKFMYVVSGVVSMGVILSTADGIAQMPQDATKTHATGLQQPGKRKGLPYA
jgi:hypothetical protein